MYFNKFKKRRQKNKRLKEELEDSYSSSEAEDEAKSLTEEPLAIYFDPHNGRYFYPITSIKDSNPVKRPLIVKRRPLKLDRKTQIYYSPQTNEIYEKFHDPEAFKVARDKYQIEMKTKASEALAETTPIYFQTDPPKFYYPLAAITQVHVFRETIPGKVH